MHTLVMWSGGLDSTAMLSHLLHETDDEITAHFIELRNDRDRWRAEREAVDSLYPKLLIKSRNFKLITTKLDLCGMKTVFDGPSMAFIAGMTCRAMPELDRVAIGWATAHENGTARRPGEIPSTMKGIYMIFEGAQYGDTKKREIVYPVRGWTKRECAEYLGAELFDMTWSCRMPIWHMSKPSPCGKCMTCRHRAMEGLKL